MKLRIPVYGCQEVSEICQGVKPIPERRILKVGSFNVVPFYVPHTKTDSGELVPCACYGYLIRHEEMGSLLYLTDLEYCPYTFKTYNVEHFLIECNHTETMLDRTEVKYEHVVKGHASLEVCKGIIESNKTDSMQNIILCHLSEGSVDFERMLKEVQTVAGDNVNVKVAIPGLEVELNKFEMEC